MFTPNAQIGIDARTIFDALDAQEIGALVSYAELTKMIGRDVRGSARAALYKAMRRQMRERTRVWATVRDVGLKLLSDIEVATTTPEELREGIRGIVTRKAKQLSAIRSFDDLPREAKTEVLTAQSVVGVIVHICSAPAQKKLRKQVEDAFKELPIGKTLEAFKQ